MTTLTIMKARIATELRRSNIASQIASAISSAIGAYQAERWLFNERRDATFATVASQEFYSASDDADIGLLVKIDYAKVIVGTTAYSLLPDDPARMEGLSDSATNTGQPSTYCVYDEQIRLYPVPDGVYTVRLAGHFIAAEPATDDEASNPWMTTGERLIRSRAKWELATHVIRDPQLAADMETATMEAWTDLKRRTTRLVGTGRIKPMGF